MSDQNQKSLFEQVREKAKILGPKKERAIIEQAFWEQVSKMESLKKYRKQAPEQKDERANTEEK